MSLRPFTSAGVATCWGCQQIIAAGQPMVCTGIYDWHVAHQPGPQRSEACHVRTHHQCDQEAATCACNCHVEDAAYSQFVLDGASQLRLPA